MRIGPAAEADLAAAAALWQERLRLLQQADASYMPLADAAAAWSARARQWLAAEDCLFAVAYADKRLIGFIVVTITRGEPGTTPERLGALSAMALDLHQAHAGLSGKLLECARDWLRARDIAMLQVAVPARYPVEDAFWQSQGANLRARQYWLAL